MDKNKDRLYKAQNGECFYCGIKMPLDALQVDHIFPQSIPFDGFLSNFILCCPECNYKGANFSFSEINFQDFITQLLDASSTFRNVNKQVVLSDKKLRADILAEENVNGSWQKVIIELKSFSTFTSNRLDEIVNQLRTYKQIVGEDVKAVFAFPGILPKKEYEIFKISGIEVWDKKIIAEKFKNEIIANDNKFLQWFFPSNMKNLKLKKSYLINLNQYLLVKKRGRHIKSS